MDPGALEWVKAGSDLLKSVGGLKGASGAPGVAASGNVSVLNTSEQDFSGFTVATNGAKAYGATIDKVSRPSVGGQVPLSGLDQVNNINPVPLLILAVGGAIAWRILKQ